MALKQWIGIKGIRQYVKRLKALYEEVRGFKKPVRITAALLGGILGIRANLDRHLNQLHY